MDRRSFVKTAIAGLVGSTIGGTQLLPAKANEVNTGLIYKEPYDLFEKIYINHDGYSILSDITKYQNDYQLSRKIYQSGLGNTAKIHKRFYLPLMCYHYDGNPQKEARELVRIYSKGVTASRFAESLKPNLPLYAFIDFDFQLVCVYQAPPKLFVMVSDYTKYNLAILDFIPAMVRKIDIQQEFTVSL